MRPSTPKLVPPAGVGGTPDAVGDARLEDGLRRGRDWAEREALARFTGLVRRVLIRILGSSAEIDDLTQEVFLRGLDRIGRLRAGSGLGPWFTSFAVNVARETLRARSRRRWLLFFAPRDLPAPVDSPLGPARFDAGTDADAKRALRATYEVLAEMGIDARTVFALRHVEGMELAEMARACGVSLATLKRRVARAEKAFYARARRHPLLRARLEEGDRCR